MMKRFQFLRQHYCLSIALLMAACLVTLSSTVWAKQEILHDIETHAYVPAEPGFPEGAAVHGQRVYVSGPARFGTAGTGPSTVNIYDSKSGELLQTLSVEGEALEYEHALSNIAIDMDGSLYVLSTQLGLIRFVRQGNDYIQEPYGDPLPDLPCSDNTNAFCPPPEVVIPPIPNDIVFDTQGYAYVTDSLQSTIFRYQPGGGAPEIWLQSPLFEGGGFVPFGLNGIRLDAMREHLYFAVTTTNQIPSNGLIYSIPLVAQPSDADLEVFHIYVNGEGPDQLAFGASGKLYVSLAFSNQISILDTDGAEIDRINSQPEDDIPLDVPAGIAFDNSSKSLLIVNHALLSGDASHFALLRAYVNEPGNTLEKPDF